MQKHTDETLVAYLDGELDGAERQEVEARIAADGAMRDLLPPAARAGRRARRRVASLARGAGAAARACTQRLCRYRQRADPGAADRGGTGRERCSGNGRAAGGGKFWVAAVG